MIKRHTKALGVCAIAIGLWTPFGAQAHNDNDTWLHVADAVVTYAHFSDHAYDHRDRHYNRYERKYLRKARRNHKRARRHHRRMHHADNHRGYRNRTHRGADRGRRHS